MHRLEAIVDAKRSSPDGAFASLKKICLAGLSMASVINRSGNIEVEAEGLDPWLGNLNRVCEESEVELHSKWNMVCRDGPSGGC